MLCAHNISNAYVIVCSVGGADSPVQDPGRYGDHAEIISLLHSVCAVARGCTSLQPCWLQHHPVYDNAKQWNVSPAIQQNLATGSASTVLRCM